MLETIPSACNSDNFGALAISGARDTLAPPSAVEALLAPAAEARLVVIPEADHFFGVGLAAIARSVAEILGGS